MKREKEGKGKERGSKKLVFKNSLLLIMNNKTIKADLYSIVLSI